VLVFVDESGNLHPNDKTRNPVLCAVCLPETAHRDFSRQLYRLKRDWLEHPEREWKAVHLMRRHVFEKTTRRREFVESFFDLLRYIEFTVFAIIMEKPASPLDKVQEGYLPNQYRYLLQRVNLYMENDRPTHEMAILVFDGQGPGGAPWGLAASISAYLFRHAEGQTWRRILDTPLFVDSKVTPGILIADMLASTLRLHAENELTDSSCGGDMFLSALQRFCRIIKEKTLDLELGDIILYGLYRMPERYLHPHPTGENGAANDL
jgi:hypothetical protein